MEHHDAEHLLIDLHAAQREAVTHTQGPLMIIAGAGTGKTTVITRRIAWLLATKKVLPHEILALTFTDKAATEMEERVDRLLPMGYVDVHISTFHAFCEKVLRMHAIHIGLSPDFRLLNEIDTWLLVRRYLDRFALEYFRPRGNPTKFLQQLLKHFSRCKDEGIFPSAYATRVEEILTEKSGGAPEAFTTLTDEAKVEMLKWRELAAAYATYEQLLAEQSAMDFGGLLLNVLELFQKRPNILKEYQEQFKQIIVDEFQDTNSIQYQLVKLLAGKERNITVVGDDDQAIYKFRGAALANILQFRADFPDAKRVVLVENYRSTKEVLDAAYTLITKNNPHRLEVAEGISKALLSHHPHAGFVKHIHMPTQNDEVQAAVRTILDFVEKGEANWGDFCLLVRANDSAEPFLEAFERFGIPFRFSAMSGLYSKPLILDLLAYLRVAVEPYHGPAWYRVLSHPRLGLSEQDVQALLFFVRRKGMPLLEAMRRVSDAMGLSMEGRNRLFTILGLLETLNRAAKQQSATEFLVTALKQSGLLADVAFFDERTQQEMYRQLEQFLARIKRFVEMNPEQKHIRAFLEEFDAEREAGEGGQVAADIEGGPDVVHVMTVHAAKGLEFRYVFVVNLIEQRFPSVSRTEALPLPPGLVREAPELDDHVAEERRLFYVAMTRAKEGLFLFSADDYGGSRLRKPSRFLQELGFLAESTPSTKKKEKPVSLSFIDKTPTTPLPFSVPEQALKQLSFSQISSFASCPAQYRYAHILHIPTFGRHQLSFGQSMHNTLQRYLEQLMHSQQAVQVTLFGETGASNTLPSLQELLTLYDAHFIDEWYPSAEIKEEYRNLGRASLKDFYERLVGNIPKPWKLEASFHLKIDDIAVKGRIDRIDTVEGGVEIIDYKTGSPKTKLEWDDKRQLVLYALAAEQCFAPPMLVQALTYYYLENNTTVSFVPTDKDKDKLREEIRETIAHIRVGDFTPTPNERICKYCDFKDICPAAKM